jgi:hypothetical protein
MKVEHLSCPTSANPEFFVVRCVTKSERASWLLFRILFFLLEGRC